MKIAHINMARDFRGGERQTLALVTALQPLLSASKHDSQCLIVRRGTKLHQAGSALANTEVHAVRPSMMSVMRQASSADLVHIHEGRSVRVGALASLLGKKFVLSRRIMKRPRDLKPTRWSYSRADKVLCVSSAVAQVMRNYINPDRVLVVPDCSRYPTQDTAAINTRSAETLRVGIVGEIDFRIKGQDVVLAVAERLAVSHPTILFRFFGSGQDADALTQRIESLANASYAGWRSNMAEEFADLDLVLQPSSEEGLGSSILEAFSFGLPVVASRVGGIPDIVTDNHNGRLVDPGSVEQIAAALADIAENPAMYQRLAEAARTTSQRFSCERMATDSLAVYRELLASERR